MQECAADEGVKAICERFDMKDLGKLHHFLGMWVVQDDESGDVWIGQPTYVEKVLEKYSMQDAIAVSTPVDVSAKLVQAGEDDELFDQGLYQSAVGKQSVVPVYWDKIGYSTYCWKCGEVLFETEEEALDRCEENLSQRNS